jgi:hypothetical protein
MEVSNRSPTSSVALSKLRTTRPIEYEAGWSPEPVWTFWRREKSAFLAGNEPPDHRARSLVAMLTRPIEL